MKVGILGGSFNPPHAGHVHVSKLALKKLNLNQIWWIPAKQNPLKQNQSDSYDLRFQLCMEITKKELKFVVKKSDEIYSYKLVESLKNKYPNFEFFWIMGADNLENLHRWKNYRKFISQINLAIFSRENSLAKIQKTKIWKFLPKEKLQIFLTKNLDISSTQIREKI
jgi:nicotinate-nucleotide adenylyltransferase